MKYEIEGDDLMKMTDEEVIASVGGCDEAERIANKMREIVDTAWIEAERRRARQSLSASTRRAWP